MKNVHMDDLKRALHLHHADRFNMRRSPTILRSPPGRRSSRTSSSSSPSTERTPSPSPSTPSSTGPESPPSPSEFDKALDDPTSDRRVIRKEYNKIHNINGELEREKIECKAQIKQLQSAVKELKASAIAMWTQEEVDVAMAREAKADREKANTRLQKAKDKLDDKLEKEKSDHAETKNKLRLDVGKKIEKSN
jgi:hypothetical protein